MELNEVERPNMMADVIFYVDGVITASGEGNDKTEVIKDARSMLKIALKGQGYPNIDIGDVATVIPQ